MKGPRPKTLAERFWPKVQKSDGCWLWVGALDPKGYGRLSRAVIGDQDSVLAHRCAWQLAGRATTPGLTLDHLCRNRRCVRVDHLEEVSAAENTRRGEAPTIVASRAGRCFAGHVVAGDNAVTTPDGRVRCVACRRASMRAYYLSSAEKRRAYLAVYNERTRERRCAYLKAWLAAHPNYKRERRARKASNG